jgi:hypothetical protein
MKYKIYIPTKGRYDRLLTADCLAKNGIDFSLVVEKKEADLYREKYPNKIIELPDSDYGGVYFARNFIKKLSRENGEKRHWQLDDDIKKLVYVNNGEFVDIPLNEIFKNMENFCDKFVNVGLASPHSSVWIKFGKKPFDVNKLAYSCLLINNSLDIWWNKDVMEDIDYNIQVLDRGWCTVRFYIYSFAWSARTSQKGGVTEIYLNKQNRFNAVKNTQEKWSLGKIVEKTVSGNTIYTVQFSNKLREYNQKLIPDFDEKYLKSARKVTQEFIETYGTDWTHIDDLDDMIAEAIKNEVKDWLEELYVQ